MVNYAEHPLKDIPEPHAHDVLCGRGGGTNNHIGNSHWRMLVAANKQLYITLPKRQKMLLSRSIVNAVRSQNPPGRFLQKDGKTKLWFDVGDQRAQEKTSQALREGAPDIRKKVAAKASAATNGSAGATSGDVSKSGANSNGGEISQIPVHPSVASRKQERKPESAGSSAVLQTAGNGGGGMPPPPEPLHFNQQQQQQQQQMNNMYVGQNRPGHMTLNERGLMIQNAVMNAGRNLHSQHHLQVNNNDNNYQQSHDAYRFQQHDQQGHLQHQIHRQQQDYQQYHYHQQQQQQQHNNNVNYQQQQQRQQHYQQEQQHRYHDNNNNNPMPAFDNFDAPPPQQLDRDGLSFGSLHMTDAEMQNLQQGSSHSKHHSTRRQQPNNKGSNSGNGNGDSGAAVPGAPMGGVLEPTGISIGDISMMSANTMKLEDTGTSFGTMMSYNTLNTTNHSKNPDMVDGGLMDAVGSSFGSLSLDKNNRDMLFKTLEIAGGGSEVPPMFRSETKSSVNLLDCSDTESESSREKEELTKQKSQAWEMMKTQLGKQTSKGASVGSQDLMPPPLGVPQHNTNAHSNNNNASAAATFDNLEINLPPTTMEANFSTLSAWSAADDGAENAAGTNGDDGDVGAIPPPPSQLTKTDSF